MLKSVFAFPKIADLLQMGIMGCSADAIYCWLENPWQRKNADSSSAPFSTFLHHLYHHPTIGLTAALQDHVTHVGSVRKSCNTLQHRYVFNDVRNDAKVGADVTLSAG